MYHPIVCILTVFLFSSCGSSWTVPSQDLTLTKQKQKIAWLEKKLKLAEKQNDQIQQEIAKFSKELATSRLCLIRNQIHKWEEEREQKVNGHESSLAKERDLLYRMIQNGEHAFEAQIMLDRVLQLLEESNH